MMRKGFIVAILLGLMVGNSFAEGKVPPVSRNEILALEQRLEKAEQRIRVLEAEVKALKRAQKAKPEAVKTVPEKSKGDKPIGYKLYVRNLSWKRYYGGRTRCIGEIVNRTGRNIEMVDIDVRVYDKNKKLIDRSDFTVFDIQNKESESFEESFDCDSKDIDKIILKAKRPE